MLEKMHRLTVYLIQSWSSPTLRPFRERFRTIAHGIMSLWKFPTCGEGVSPRGSPHSTLDVSTTAPTPRVCSCENHEDQNFTGRKERRNREFETGRTLWALMQIILSLSFLPVLGKLVSFPWHRLHPTRSGTHQGKGERGFMSRCNSYNPRFPQLCNTASER